MSVHEEEFNEDDIPREITQSKWKTVWQENKGMLLILISEIAGSSMDAIARFVQQGGHSMHPFQVITARMGITFLLSSFYMWYTKVPDFPFGKPSVRKWLLLRAVFGFSGLYCLYYSVHYLPLAEATVFRFLVPIVTAYSCSIFLSQPFTRSELLAGLVALAGIIIIAHPAAIFGDVDDSIHAAGDIDNVTPTQRLIAIAVSIVGVLGAVGAYTTIRIIGDRAHALLSVNYFAILGTSVSSLALLLIPGIGFTMPQGAREWLLLIFLGVLGFVLQFLLTAGLQLDKSSRATSMMYLQVVFALGFDWGIWGVIPGGWSLVGGAIVIASTLWSALHKGHQGNTKTGDGVKDAIVDEESALLGAQTEGLEEVVQSRIR